MRVLMAHRLDCGWSSSRALRLTHSSSPLHTPLDPAHQSLSPLPWSTSIVMADVIGILGFALHAAHKLYDVVETIRDAPKEIKALQTQASLVRAFVPDIQQTFEEDTHTHPPSNDLQLRILLEQATQLHDEVDAFLGKVTMAKTDGSHEVKKIVYIFRASGGRELQKQFERFIALLTAINTSRFV